MIYIFDLDGTLADTSHRLHFIEGDKKDWRGFFAAAKDDAPIVSTIKTYRALRKAGAECWIWTGRSDEVRSETVEWLHRHGVWGDERTQTLWAWPLQSPERFRMRKAGDHRHDHVIKAEWLAQVDPPEYERIVAVYEDRARVVQMWRDAGLTCYQVAPGEF